MDIWKIEKPFDYKIFFSNLTPHAACYILIRHSGKYCTHQVVWLVTFQAKSAPFERMSLGNDCGFRPTFHLSKLSLKITSRV